MDWISAQQPPDETGNYMVSISMSYKNNQRNFRAIARYDQKTQRWYKYEPFEPEKIGDDITSIVVGWVNDRDVYLK